MEKCSFSRNGQEDELVPEPETDETWDDVPTREQENDHSDYDDE